MRSLPDLEFNSVGKQSVGLIRSRWGTSMLKKIGAKMKLWTKILVLLCLCWPACGVAQIAEPVWKLNLTQKFGLQAFDRTINFRWTLHQGVVFISPERVLVYQVNRSRRLAKLAQRDASGGSGNFILQIKVLNAQDGSEIKSLELPTNADFSKVIATHDGKFIARTGDILYLYSANFERLASHPLPLKRQAAEEGWEIGVSPSGGEVTLAHEQVFHRSAISPTSSIEKAATDVEVLNADTLQLLRGFSLPSVWDYWSAAEHFLLTSTPQPSTSAADLFGALNIDGSWAPILPDWYSPRQPCRYQLAALEHDLLASYGCGHFSVFPRMGDKIFSMKNRSDDFVRDLVESGEYYAIEVEHRTILHDTASNIPVVRSQPLHVDLYPLKGTLPLISVPVHSANIYYAVSSSGTMAVADGTSLAFFAPKPLAPTSLAPKH